MFNVTFPLWNTIMAERYVFDVNAKCHFCRRRPNHFVVDVLYILSSNKVIPYIMQENNYI